MSKFPRLHPKVHRQLPRTVLFCEALRRGQRLFPGVGAGPSLIPPGCSVLIVFLQNVFHDLRDDHLPLKLKEEFHLDHLEATETQKRRHVKTEARRTAMRSNKLMIGNSNLMKEAALF